MNEYKLPPVRLDSPPMKMHALSQQIDWGLRERSMPEIWERSAGEGVLVFILDTGVPEHIDLPDPLFTENFTNESSRYDHDGHHTHCAGIVAATNDSNGVVGWAPEATLAHIKVLDDYGHGFATWISRGIRSATQKWNEVKSDFVGCLISMSLGGEFNEDQERAIVEANEAGILVVAAAGNSGYRGGKSTIDHPGASPHTIGVAAYRNDGGIASFSSGGPEVDIAMPGEEVLSTVPRNRYQVMSGTSMATPAAAGLLACVLASRPHDNSIRTIDGMRALIKAHAEDRGALGKDNRFGFGVPKPDELVRDNEYWFF
jgi:subtilisin family serine protease